MLQSNAIVLQRQKTKATGDFGITISCLETKAHLIRMHVFLPRIQEPVSQRACQPEGNGGCIKPNYLLRLTNLS